MKICFIEQRFVNRHKTGPTRHIRELAASLANSGHEVHVVCESVSGFSRASAASYLLSGNRVRVLELKGYGIGNQKTLRGLVRYIRKERPDIVHVQGYRNLVSDTAAIACLLNSIPLVLSPRGSLLGYSYRRVDSLIPVAAKLYDTLSHKMTLEIAEAVVVATAKEKQEALSLRIPPEKIFVISHGIVFPDIPREKQSIEGNPMILTVSRITPHRNIIEVIQSMEFVLKHYPDAVLHIVGEPIAFTRDAAERMYPMKVRELAEIPKLRGHVRLHGGVYGDTLWGFYSAADLFAYASSYDNFGFGLLEAACFGVPIVSTDVGIASDLVGSGQGGAIIPRHEPQLIADAILRTLANQSELAQMRRHLKVRSRQYSIEANRDSYISLYQQLLR